MKRCPQCGREYDVTMSYCLDDGSELLYGPAGVSRDEPRTAILHETGQPAIAILHETAPPGEAETRAQIFGRDTADEVVDTSRRRVPTSAAIVLGAALLVLASAFFGYRYFNADAKQINSIAVLPFENRSGAADSDYLSDGLTDSLIYRLSQLPDLKVSPTNSVMRYKGKEAEISDVAKQLQVDAVMSGRMVQRGDDLNISVQLVDARTQKLVWAEQYERKMADLLATQREIAGAIVSKLQLRLSREGEQKLTKTYTQSNEAYQFYLKGRFYWNKRDEENLRKAIEQFKSAADADPDFALAYVGLADSYAILPFYSSVPSSEALPKAQALAERALSIDDSLGEAHTSLGYTKLYSWDWPGAEKELKRGIELSPNYATAHKFYANYLGDLGRNEAALSELKRARELEPLTLVINSNLSDIYLAMGDLPGAAEECERGLELDPNWYLGWRQLGYIYLRQGRNADALAASEKAAALTNRESVTLGFLGHVYAQTGKQKDALAVLNELKDRYVQHKANGYDVARVYLGLGEKDQTFAWLEKDVQSHTSVVAAWLYTPPFADLQADARFKDLVDGIGMPIK